MKCKLLCFFLFVLLTLSSCGDSSFGKKQFEFYYYPSKNVYYDVVNSQYIYSVDGGKTWNTFKSKTNTEPATLGNKQIIYSDDEQPWKLNQVHRRQYNATVISVTDVDTTAQQNIVTNKKITVKKPALNVDAPVKEEKKPGFFKRLFGGKKHNNNIQ